MRTRLQVKSGAVVVFTAVLLVVLLGMVALSVDLGVQSVTRAQLRTSSDAAALAGAAKLATDRRIASNITSVNPEISGAQSAASTIARINKVLGAEPVIVFTASNTPSNDIAIGYLDPNNAASTLDCSSTLTLLFNSVQVRLQRSSERGGLIPTSFARILGIEGMQAVSTGTATALLFRIGGFKTDGGQNAHLLPIVLDKDTYDKMIDPVYNTTDQYTYNTSTRTITSGADGVQESKLYPVKDGLPGNWGTIKIGVDNNSTSTLGSQIRYGITPSQMARYPGGIKLDPSTSPPSITFEGNPGISSGIKDDLTAILGRPVSLPIFDQSQGNGNNATYRVVGFAPVRLMAVNFQGNPKYVIVQPALVRDPTAVPTGGPLTGWTSGGLVRLRLSR